MLVLINREEWSCIPILSVAIRFSTCCDSRREEDLPSADTKELRKLHLSSLRVGAWGTTALAAFCPPQGRKRAPGAAYSSREDYWHPLPGTSSPAGTKIKRYKDILIAISNHYMCLIVLLNIFKSHSFAAWCHISLRYKTIPLTEAIGGVGRQESALTLKSL